MSEPIYPRSPRETMCGWMHLPRYIDKIRLHLSGQLHPDYQTNFGKGFDVFFVAEGGPSVEVELCFGTAGGINADRSKVDLSGEVGAER